MQTDVQLLPILPLQKCWFGSLEWIPRIHLHFKQASQSILMQEVYRHPGMRQGMWRNRVGLCQPLGGNNWSVWPLTNKRVSLVRKIILSEWEMWPSFPSGSVVKSLPANAGDTEIVGSIPGSILAWKFPWTEEPGKWQSRGLQRVRHDWADTHIHMDAYTQEVVGES